jgi:hypothetical protein
MSDSPEREFSMTKASLLRTGVLFVLTSICGAASAGVILQTGFKLAAYSPGALDDQNQWLNAAIPTVEASIVFSESQALAYDVNLVSAQI